MAKSWYKEQYEETSKEFSKLKIAATQHVATLGETVKEITATKEGIDKIFLELSKREKEFNEKSTSLEEIIADIEDSHGTINDTYNKLIETRDSIFGKTISEDEELPEDQAVLLPKSDYTEKQGKFYRKKKTHIPGTVEAINSYSKTIEDKIKLYTKSINDFEIAAAAAIKEKLDAVDYNYNSLRKKIEELLPGATSAGLSSAYAEARDDHLKQVSFWRIVFFQPWP